MRACDNRYAQGSRLQQIVTADGYQTATDKGNIARSIEQRDLTHSVAQKYQGIGITGSLIRSQNCRQTSFLEKLAND